uniref:Putative serine proteinase inhibitor n=1 Tax=Amblyomma cajennense TaxID=34607 RepID=A0A023FRM3_AMBCJ
MKCPLIAFVSLYASAALMAAENGHEDLKEKRQCKTPQRPFFESLDNTDFLFIFNETSRLCEKVFIDPTFRNHTFDSRFKCVSECNTGQGAPFCAQKPRNACNDSATSDEVYISYFYNVSSGKCEEYDDCVYFEKKEEDVNGFYDIFNCEFECKGFSEADVCGSNRSEQIE